MKTLSLVISLIGISTLFAVLILSHPLAINNQKELEKLLDNSKVQITGKAIKQTPYSITLDNNITLICESCPPCKNKEIQAIGTIKRYKNSTKIYVSVIKFLIN